MNYIIDGEEYKVEVIKKANKNTYIRVKNDLSILVTTNYLVTKKQINKLLDQNQDFLSKSLYKKRIEQENKQKFYYLGSIYDIIIMPIKNIEICNNRIYVSNENILNKWLKKQAEEIFKERLKYCFNLFEENIYYPKFKIRSMKTRWGVCNRKTQTITLNFDLIKWKLEYIDYVIIHELSHIVHFNHSKEFWSVVYKYCPDYKRLRKELRN